MKSEIQEVNNVLKYPHIQEMAVLQNEFSQLRAIIYRGLGNSSTQKAFDAVKAKIRAISPKAAAEQKQRLDELKNKDTSLVATKYEYTEAEQNAIMLFYNDKRFSVTE